jgi:hypothetical protein
MHIHTRKNLSHLAITSSLPNLGNLVHSQQVNAYDPSSGDSRDIAAFTLWTMEGHVLMADGSVARTPKQEDTLPDDHEGLVVVHDEELNEYPELLKNSLLKTVNRIATTMAMPTDHPTKWAEVKVTRALLRQTRRQARPDSGQARPEA